MSLFLSSLLSGLSTGCLYAFVAVGYTVVFKATGVFNLAQGDLVMVGIMGSYYFLEVEHWPMVPSYIVVLLLVTAISLIEERLVVRQFLERSGAESFGWFIATLGFGLIVQTVVLILYGKRPTVGIRSPVPNGGFRWGSITVGYQQLLVIGLFVALVIGMELFYRRTWFGQAMRATSEDRDAARLLGINPVIASRLGFALGGVAAAVAGIAVAPITFSDPNVGLSLALKGFLALAMGGFGSLSGAIIGGIILGVAEHTWDLYIGSDFDVLVGVILVLVVLSFRPGGLTSRTRARIV